jgi:methylthioribose-1-phosphate isomerase
VFVDETRPLLQGGRLTAYELERERIPYTLICDNMAAVLMRQGKIQRIFVGADRIACNGDFANKIGTFGVAVIAHHHRIPMHAVAPLSTFDARCASGDGIHVEQRGADEVRGAMGVRWAPVGANTFNPAFDVTPVELVTSIIVE